MLFGFGRRPIVDRETLDWTFETYEWLFRSFGGYRQFRGADLVLPTAEHFPVEEGLAGHALAEAVFARVKDHAGMPDWPCVLEAQEADPDPIVGIGHAVQGLVPSPAGTFDTTGDDAAPVRITYDEALLSDPVSLVATMAHELAHFLIATAPSLPPGDEELLEFATDLTAVYLGFGVFLVNSHFQFGQHGDTFSQGWAMRRSGYLSERELLTALAIFAALLDIPPATVTPPLKPSLRGLYRRAAASVAAETEWLDRLRNTAADG